MNFLKPRPGNACLLTGAFSFYPDPQSDSRLKALWASLLSAPAHGLPGPKAFQDFPAKGSAVPQNRTMNFLKPGSGNTCFLTGAFSFYPDPQPASRLKALWASLLSAPAHDFPGPKAFQNFPLSQGFGCPSPIKLHERENHSRGGSWIRCTRCPFIPAVMLPR